MNPVTLFALRTPWLIVLVSCVAGIVYLAWAADAHPRYVIYTDRRLERITIALAMLSMTSGFVLTYLAASRNFAELTADIGNGRVIDLGHEVSEKQLQAALRFIEPESERQFVVRRLHSWLTEPGHSGPPNVGAVSRLDVSDATITQTPGVPNLEKRLEEARGGGRSRNISLLSSPQIRTAKPYFIVRTPTQFKRDFQIWAAIVAVSFVIVHLVWSRFKFAGDELLLAPVSVLCGIGFIVVTSLRDPLRDTELFIPFAEGIAAGCAALLMLSFVDVQRRLARLTFVPLAVSLGLSVALLAFGSGPGTSDAKVNLGPFQPVEAMRIFLILFMAAYFGKRWQFLRELRERRPGFSRVNRYVSVPKLDHLVPVVICIALTLAFFYFQKDFGPALLVACLFLALYGIARGRGMLAAISVTTVVVGMAVGTWFGFPSTVAARVRMFVSPWSNVVRGGDQLASSLWALSSGGVFGSGVGLGDPAQVPAAHTDMVLAAVGEELGFLGVCVVFLCWGTVLFRGRRIAQCAGSAYTFFLAGACVLATAFQVILIAGGVLGLAPLSGVVSPFLSYGRSSMVANCILVGMLASVSSRHSPPGEVVARSKAGIHAVSWVVAGLFAVLLCRAAFVQIWAADDIAATGVAVKQQDGVRRLQYNPRLFAVADDLGRGSIVDRNGLPLASSDLNEVARYRKEFQQLGVGPDNLSKSASRYYPFGAETFHVLGDIRTHRNWTATNTAYIERDFERQLRGFDFTTSRDGETSQSSDRPALGYHDYSPLVPLLRHRYDPNAAAVKAVLDSDRRVTLTIDGPLTVKVTELLRRHLSSVPGRRGAVVVIDVDSGGILASVSVPIPDAVSFDDAADGDNELFDRARFGLYPPGSVFKLVTAAAAIRADSMSAGRVFICQRLPDGRVGAKVRGWTVRDDITDKHEHGAISMKSALAQSCNAYFAQLAVNVGSANLLEMAKRFGMRVAVPNTASQLERMLPQAGYGQGEVLVSPLQIATLAATIAGGCRIPRTHIVDQPTAEESDRQPILDEPGCRTLAAAMRAAVTDGTGQLALKTGAPIAGKTGTAELQAAPSHAWFAGFAPYGASEKHRIAFSVFVENGGYGGSVAAPIAAEVVTTAKEIGIIR